MIIETASEPEERDAIWYNRQDFQAIRTEIGDLIIKARALRDWRVEDDSDDDCFRGLEFLKMDASTPSRKERRLCFAKNVLLFQYMSGLSRNDNDTDNQTKVENPSKEVALATYCARLSQAAKARAQALAAFDDSEARQVYYECGLLYQMNGKEMRMFASTCALQAVTTNCLKHHHHEDSIQVVANTPLPEVFSTMNTLARVMCKVRNSSTALFTTTSVR